MHIPLNIYLFLLAAIWASNEEEILFTSAGRSHRFSSSSSSKNGQGVGRQGAKKISTIETARSLGLSADCSPSAGFLWSRGLTMPIAASLPTQGNSGFEAFSIDGVTYLAASNFWDGKAQDMSAKSAIYSVQLPESSTHASDPSSKDPFELVVKEIKKYPSWGAHSVDFFEVRGKETEKVLVTTNYYKCNSYKENPEKCLPLNILKYNPPPVSPSEVKSDNDEAAAKMNSANLFTLDVDLKGVGPAQSDHFYYNKDTFLVVADNFASKVAIYRYTASDEGYAGGDSKWQLFQELNCPGVAAIATSNTGGDRGGKGREGGSGGEEEILLVAASYHDNGWATKSPVYKMSSLDSKFVKIQEISTQGAHDVELFTFKDDIYLFASEDRKETTPYIDSKVLRYNKQIGKFVVIQSIPTYGAHAAELFDVSGSLYLAIANFGDRHNKAYAAESTLWMLTPGDRFELACNINTQGATDFEHFRIDGVDFLIASNEGDLEKNEFQQSVVYRMAFKPDLIAEEDVEEVDDIYEGSNSMKLADEL